MSAMCWTDLPGLVLVQPPGFALALALVPVLAPVGGALEEAAALPEAVADPAS